ncbi:MAG: diguanylate cyclase [Proteobacteria bacterium]|nr:diguanylate cyclase [Pseudomonadota bacterium]
MKKAIPAKHSWLIWFVCLLVMSVAAGWYVSHYLGNIAKKEIIDGNEASTNTLSILLNAEFSNMEGAVKALAGSPWIAPALMTKRTGDIEHAYSVLVRYNTAVDATVSYLMDSAGTTVASSNRNDPDSFVGHSYAFRPYFKEAVLGNTFSYLAAGTTSRKNGFYSSAPVMDDQKNILGVVTVKKELHGIEAHMRKFPHCFLIDANGIIFLSSKPDMTFKSLWPVNREVEKKLLASKQFGERRFDAVMDLEITDGMDATLDGKGFIASRKHINLGGWSIVLMTPRDRINVYRLTGVLTAGFIFLLIAIPLIIHYRTVKLIENIRQSEERYRSLFENMLDGFAYCKMLYDEQGRPVDFVYLDVNEAFERLTGPKDVVGKKVSELIPGIKELNPELFDIYGRVALTGKTETFEINFKPLAKQLSVSVYSTQKGYFVAVFDDITERKQFEEKIIYEHKRLQMLLESAPFGIMLVSENGLISYVNPKFTEIFGYEPDEIPDGKTWFKKAYPDAEYRKSVISTWIDDMKEITPGEKTPRLFTATCKDGTKKSANIITVKLESGEYLVTFEDRTELQKYQESLAYFAMHDVLTELLNRRSLEETLNRSIARAKRGNISSLLYMDLDNFKDVNDTLGHSTGDEVLITLTGILKEALRTEDIVFRLGGDEFAVFLEGIDGKEALLAAERLRASVEAYRLELDHRVFPLSLSIGLVEVNGTAGAGELLSKADTAMYAAKEQGKNRVIIAT